MCVHVWESDRVWVLAWGYSVIERPSVSSWTISSSAVQNVPQISQSDRYSIHTHTHTQTNACTRSYGNEWKWQIRSDMRGQRGIGILIFVTRYAIIWEMSINELVKEQLVQKWRLKLRSPYQFTQQKNVWLDVTQLINLAWIFTTEHMEGPQLLAEGVGLMIPAKPSRARQGGYRQTGPDQISKHSGYWEFGLPLSDIESFRAITCGTPVLCARWVCRDMNAQARGTMLG